MGEPFESFAVAVEVRWAEASIPSEPFMSFVPFMLFLFRLVERQPEGGAVTTRTIVSRDHHHRAAPKSLAQLTEIAQDPNAVALNLCRE